jgi:hypothetical protein
VNNTPTSFTEPTETQAAEADESNDVDACLFNYVTCDVTVSGSDYRSTVTVAASFSNHGIGIGQALRDFGSIGRALAGGLDVAADAHLSAFSAALFGQPFRAARVASLETALAPLKAFATKLGIAGLTIDMMSGVSTFIATGNPVPLIVSGIGFGAAAVIASYSAPAAFGFAIVYGVAGYYGVFDSHGFD